MPILRCRRYVQQKCNDAVNYFIAGAPAREQSFYPSLAQLRRKVQELYEDVGVPLDMFNRVMAENPERERIMLQKMSERRCNIYAVVKPYAHGPGGYITENKVAMLASENIAPSRRRTPAEWHAHFGDGLPGGDCKRQLFTWQAAVRQRRAHHPVHNHLSPLTCANARSTTCMRAVSPSSLSSHPRAANHPPAAARAVVKSKVGAGKPLALDPQGLYVCPDACGVESTSPNGKPAIDATISTLTHELTEAATDPDTNAGWFDDNNEENADKCSCDYGSTKRGSLQNGQSYEYNLVGLNGMKFLVQLNWDRVRSKCILQNALPTDSSGGGGTPSPPSPPPPPPPTGGSVKMKCDCNCASASNPMSY
ncbi:unnamed protein product [Closterium sp. NIES-65]|nr:unnamed protein product [Closterium sp. NIES-65]